MGESANAQNDESVEISRVLSRATAFVVWLLYVLSHLPWVGENRLWNSRRQCVILRVVYLVLTTVYKKGGGTTGIINKQKKNGRAYFDAPCRPSLALMRPVLSPI